MAQPQEFPFNIMDVAELLHLHIRRRQADSVYADCPICGDKRGKMNINFAKNLWRCNYYNEGGGMLLSTGRYTGSAILKPTARSVTRCKTALPHRSTP